MDKITLIFDYEKSTKNKQVYFNREWKIALYLPKDLLKNYQPPAFKVEVTGMVPAES